jgi:WD40 repeat protein
MVWMCISNTSKNEVRSVKTLITFGLFFVCICLSAASFFLNSKYQETKIEIEVLEQESQKSLIQNLLLRSEIMRMKEKPIEVLAYSRLGSYLKHERTDNGELHEHDYNLLRSHATGKYFKTLKDNDEQKSTCWMSSSGCKDHYNIIQLSPKGTLLVTTSDDRKVIVWDVSRGNIVQTFEEHKKNISAMTISLDESLVATGSEDGVVHLWEVSTGRLLQSFASQNTPISAIAILPNNMFVVTGGEDGNIKVWDVSSGDIQHTWIGHEDSISELSSPSNNQIISISLEDGAKVWDLKGALIQEFYPQQNESTIHVSSDGKNVFSLSNWGKITNWDLESEKRLSSLRVYGDIYVTAISQDGRYLATGSLNGLIQICDISTGVVVHKLKLDSFSTDAISISPDGKMVVISSLEGEIHILDTSSTSMEHSLKGEEDDGAMRYLSMGADGTTLFTATKNKNVFLWNMKDGAMLHSYQHSNQISALSNHESVFAVGSDDGLIYLRDISSGNALQEVNLDNPVEKITLTSDKIIASSSNNIRVWERGQSAFLKDYPGDVFDVNEDGSQIAIYTERAIKIVDVDNGNTIHTFKDPPLENANEPCDFPEMNSDIAGGCTQVDVVYLLDFSPNSSFITAVFPHMIKIWDLQSGRLIFQTQIQAYYISSIAIDPKETVLIASYLEDIIKIWDISTGQLLHVVTDNFSNINKIQIHPNGKTFASLSSGDTKLSVWEISSGQLLQSFQEEDFVDFMISTDGKHIVTGERDTKARIWAYPKMDIQAVFKESGLRSNYRVCKDTFRVVSVLPFPTDTSVWSEPEHCQSKPPLSSTK